MGVEKGEDGWGRKRRRVGIRRMADFMVQAFEFVCDELTYVLIHKCRQGK